MLESEAVRKIGFTGSTNVGKGLMAGAAQTVKKVSLELGGNAPYIIFDDADIELAATGVVSSAFRNAGQTCICANKILVQASTASSTSCACQGCFAQVPGDRLGCRLQVKRYSGSRLRITAALPSSWQVLVS